MSVPEPVVAGVTLTAGVIWLVYLLLFGSDAGLPFFPVVIVLVVGGAAVLVLWALRVVLHLAITRRVPERRRVRWLVAQPMVLLVCIALVASGAAFRVRFMLSQSSLSNYVQTASPATTWGSSAAGVRVGLFRLREVEALPQGVGRMITTECGVIDACGLVYSPASTPPVVGEDVYDSLGGPWYHWYRRF